MTHGNYDHEEQDSQDFQEEYKLWRKLESIENGLKELEGTIRDFAGKQAKRREHFIPTNAPYKPLAIWLADIQISGAQNV